MDQSAHTKCAGVKDNSLLLKTEPSRPEIVAISSSFPLRINGLSLYGMMIEPPIIHYDQENATVSI